MFKSLNNSRKWTKDTKDFEYIKLREFLDANGWETEITVYGYYINQLKRGKACTIIADDCFINMPSHTIKVFESLSDEQNAAIAEGKLILKNFKNLTTDYGNDTIVFDYDDAE